MDQSIDVADFISFNIRILREYIQLDQSLDGHKKGFTYFLDFIHEQRLVNPVKDF